jgi:hypothetical protein
MTHDHDIISTVTPPTHDQDVIIARSSPTPAHLLRPLLEVLQHLAGTQWEVTRHCIVGAAAAVAAAAAADTPCRHRVQFMYSLYSNLAFEMAWTACWVIFALNKHKNNTTNKTKDAPPPAHFLRMTSTLQVVRLFT